MITISTACQTNKNRQYRRKSIVDEYPPMDRKYCNDHYRGFHACENQKHRDLNVKMQYGSNANK